MGRAEDVDRFYELMETLQTRVGGYRRLADCDGYMDWPSRGVYFFFDPDEHHTSSDHLRLTRVGTHAVSEGSSTSLWDRLRTHRGNFSGTYEDGGNHRGSVFRERVGEALINREERRDEFPDWSVGSSAQRDKRLEELPMERRVSDYLRNLPFLWIAVDDQPGPQSDRAYLERQTIALISNYNTDSIDPRPESWLGSDSPSPDIRKSGLWNINHVSESYDPEFLDRLETAIHQTDPV